MHQSNVTAKKQRNIFKSIDYVETKSKISSDILSNRGNAKNSNAVNKLTFNKGLHPLWYIPPIDLTPKSFTHNKIKIYHPEINSNKSNINLDSSFILPTLSIKQQDKAIEFKEFVSKNRPLTANTARREALKTLCLPKGTYQKIKPYCYNDIQKLQSEEEFNTNMPKDPLNIKFKNRMLKDTLPELTTSSKNGLITRHLSTERQFFTAKTKYLGNWEKHLYFQAQKYGTNPQDLFYERVEQTLDWIKGKKFPKLDRPDIFNNRTVDWLQVTSVHNKHKCMNMKT